MKQPERGVTTSRNGVDMVGRRGSVPQQVAGARRPTGPTIDWVKLGWGNRWLLLLGLSIGLGGGYFQFVQSPAMYRTSARVQIIEPSSKNLPVRGVESSSTARSIGDEALVMRSERILKRAAEIGELSMMPEFSGMPAEHIAAIIGNPYTLLIGPPEKSESKSVLEVQYSSTSSATCQRVVQSVIDAYAMHLQEQYRNVGQETLDLIQTARNEVLEKLNSLESDFGQFKQDSALVFRDGATTSIHRDNADKFLGQKQNLLIEKGRLLSKLEAARLAMQQKRPIEAVLIALQMSDGSENVAKQSSEEISRLREVNQSTVSERMRREQLLPLQLEKQDLASSVGADHPAMKTLDHRIRAMQNTIDEIALSEQDFRRQLEAAWAKEESVTQKQLEPTAIMENRVKIGVLALRQQLESIGQEENLIDEAYRSEMEKAKSESVAETRSAQFFREIERQQQLYNRIMERLDEVNLMSDSTGLKLFPLDTAKPGYQFAPSLAKSLLMGGFLGCMLAGGLAFLREIADRSYHGASDIAEHIGLPVIGHVPVLSNKRMEVEGKDAFANIDPRLCTVYGGKGSKSEAFRAIRTAIYFSNQAGNQQILQVTSATPGEGKSTIAANLAVTIAQSGRSVLLIDADLRRPRVHKLFGIESDQGLAWAIGQVAASPRSSGLSFAEAILETPVPNLSIMVAGVRPDNPAELLSSMAFETLLETLRSKFDMIIVDTPPMLAVSDPSNVVRRADGVVMVVRLRKNVKPVVAQATRMLETLEANVIGVVVNGVGSRQARGYGKESAKDGYYNNGPYYKYGYGYSYGTTTNGAYSEYYDEAKVSKRRKGPKAVAVGSVKAADLASSDKSKA